MQYFMWKSTSSIYEIEKAEKRLWSFVTHLISNSVQAADEETFKGLWRN